MARPSKLSPELTPSASDVVGAMDLALFLSGAVEAGLVSQRDRRKVEAKLRGKPLAEVAAYFGELKRLPRSLAVLRNPVDHADESAREEEEDHDLSA